MEFLIGMSIPSRLIEWASAVLFSILAVWLYRKTNCPGSRELAYGYCIRLLITAGYLPLQWLDLLTTNENDPFPLWLIILLASMSVIAILCQLAILVGFFRLVAFVVRSGKQSPVSANSTTEKPATSLGSTETS